MRGISRIGSLAALTAVIALGASSSAFATGASDQYMDLTGAVNPNNLPPASGAAKGVNLLLQPQWLNNPDIDSPIPAEGAEEIRLDIDDDVLLQTKKLPTCNADPTALGSATTAQAIALCGGNTQVGSGAAKIRYSGFAALDPLNNQVDFTVTAFNGPPSVAGPSECADTNLGGPFNCEWVGGDPTLYLHAYNQATSQSSLVRGEIQDAGDGTLPGTGTPAIAAGYNQRLAVTDGTDVAGDAGAVSLFNAVVGKAYKYKKGTKTIKANYVSARCDTADDVDPVVPGTQAGLKFKGETVYDDDETHGGASPSIDTDSTFQLCSPTG